ncbi:MAG: sialate O-acetylesterase [Phycisphaeraceae bacterium]
MKKSVLYSLLAVLFVGSANAENFDVYIMAGQSNMDGRGTVSALPTALQAAQPNARIYYANPNDGAATTRSGWTDLAPGYSIGPGASSIPSNTFGPEVSFGGAIASAVPTGNKVAIIKVSKGGTSLQFDWSPTGFMYQALVTEVGTALQALADNGDTATVRGMVWHQGESDVSDINNYQGNLEELIANVRAIVNDDALPFVIGELADTKSQAFRTMQAKIATDNVGVGFTSSAGLNVIGGGDTTHFDTDAQVIFGQRYAETMATLVPEPSSLGLLGLGAFCLLRKRRR